MSALRIAVPNKGSLSLPAAALFADAGYRSRPDVRDLQLLDHANDVEFFFLRPRDIALYVGSGTLDVGITGRDLLLDSRAAATEVLSLGFGSSTFRFAARPDTARAVADLTGRRIATSYPGLVEDHLRTLGVTAEVVRLDGAVESAVSLGVADAIADVVETGATMRSAGLEVFGDPILQSEAVLVRRVPGSLSPAGAAAFEVLRRRLEGVLIARSWVMVDYDCPAAVQQAACAITPGIESPTVSPLARPGWVAVRSLVPRARAPFLMDELWEVGARAILLTPLEACRL